MINKITFPLVILTLISFLSITASASETTLYSDQSNKICQMLNKSLTLYSDGKIKEAYDLSESSYWDGYDSILEIKYRPYTSPAHIFSVENQFHEISTSMTAPVTEEKTQASAEKIHVLCEEIQKQAKYLTDLH